MTANTRPPEIEHDTQTKTRLMPLYKLLLHNDIYNSMHHVIRALVDVMKIKTEEAASIMLEAHNNGIALITIEPLEHAELHSDQLQSYSLTVSIEPE